MSIDNNDNVQAEILKKAQELFMKFGFKKTTMDDIADACGKAKSTLYHYFTSKNEVFDAVIDMEIRELRCAVKPFVDKEIILSAKIIAYMIQYHKEIVSRINIYRILNEEVIKNLSSQKYFKKVMGFEKNYLIRLLEDGFDAGEFTSHQREDIPWLAELLLAAFIGIVRFSVERDSGFDQEKLEKSARMIIPKIFS